MLKVDSTNFQKNPVIVPESHHIATLRMRQHHQRISHQGRHLTEGAVRSAGLRINGGKDLCLKCSIAASPA